MQTGLVRTHPTHPPAYGLARGDVLSSGGCVARGVRTVECIVANEVDQCQLCLVDLQEGVDNEA